MSMLDNIGIGKRLGAGFALVLTTTLLIAGLGIWYLHALGDSTRAMMAQPLAKERMIGEWRMQTFGAVRRTAAIVKSADPSLTGFFKEDIAATAERTTTLMKQIEGLLSNDEERAQLRKATELRAIYTKAKDHAVKVRNDGNAAEANRLLDEEFKPRAKAYEDAVGKLLDMQHASMSDRAAEIDATIAASARMIAILGAIAVAVGALCSWRLTRSIVQPIRAAVDAAETVASGDLTRRIEAHTGDETGALLRALGHMNDNLVRIVGDMRSGTGSIHGAASEIAAGNLDLSSRTEQQAAALEETAASMTHLTQTVRQNADNAQRANQLSIAASGVAADGGAVMAQVVQTMGSINQASQRIVDIIGVIDGIAFQTNILALNAAVEAARAGEQGRGFAVVAAEVRNLAQRSGTAAKEIKTLIDDSVAKVDTGTRLVDQAGDTMRQVVDSIGRVTGIMAEITTASAEQTAGIEQVNRAIGQMDETTQQNAALVEEATAAAGALQDQAARLAQAADRFKLERAAPPPGRPALETAR